LGKKEGPRKTLNAGAPHVFSEWGGGNPGSERVVLKGKVESPPRKGGGKRGSGGARCTRRLSTLKKSTDLAGRVWREDTGFLTESKETGIANRKRGGTNRRVGILRFELPSVVPKMLGGGGEEKLCIKRAPRNRSATRNNRKQHQVRERFSQPRDGPKLRAQQKRAAVIQKNNPRKPRTKKPGKGSNWTKAGVLKKVETGSIRNSPVSRGRQQGDCHASPQGTHFVLNKKTA